MSSGCRVLGKAIDAALSGRGAHVELRHLCAGLSWKLAGTRPKGAPHSVFQLLSHMIYWQEWVVQWLEGQDPPLPKHASGSWPGGSGPKNPGDWQRAVRRFRSGLEKLDRQAREQDLFAGRGRKCRLEMLQTIASHNSYHAGQLVALRQMLGAWPPPSGGLTW
jgi:uncharacterized damage-inducible protein DinB